jgi:HAD superfamily hydrolase (TIGR01549 family)
VGELVTPPVSFDLWDTVLWHPGGPNPASRDRVALVAQLTGAEPAEVSRALRGRPLPYDQDSPRDLTLTTQLSDALAALDASPRAVAKAVERFMELSFRYPPIPAPGLRRVLPRLAQGQLAIVSNTRWTPGAVLERFLAEEGLAEFFATLAFSDQTGWAKPAAGAFAAAWDRVGVDARRTVHIGDRVDRDVEGAKRVGAKGVVCRVIRRAREDGDRRADGILCEYAGLEAMLARVCDRDMPGWELVAEGVPVLGPPVLGRVSVPEPVPPGEAGPVARDGRIALLADGEASPGGPVDWAAAIVAETGDADGAVARHAAAVGIPCVVGAKGLRRRAGEGDLLLVDGATGQVHAPVDGRD